MSRRMPTPRLRRWFDAATEAGWDVDEKIKRAILTHPQGTQVIVSLTPNDTDFRRFENRMRTYGVVPPTPKSDDRLNKLSVQQRAAMVWDHMRTAALDRDYPYEVYRGVGYYRWNSEPLTDVIQEVFPTLTEYEPEKRPSREGQRPIYDYLRANGNVVSLGQQATDRAPGEHLYLVSDVWNVAAVAEASLEERPKQQRVVPEKPVPSVIRGRTDQDVTEKEAQTMVEQPQSAAEDPEPEKVQLGLSAVVALQASVAQHASDLTDTAQGLRQVYDRLAELPAAFGGNDLSELAYWKTDADQQRKRAERSEDIVRQIRHAVETLPIGQAFAKIIEIVPPSPLAR